MTTKQFYARPGVDETPKSADVVVIGGGPAGAAAVWGLERAQPGIKTVLIERAGQLAAGSSTASLENYRTAWGARCLATMMQRSIEILRNADDFLGEGAQAVLGIKQQGYLWYGLTPRQAEALKEEVEHLQNMGNEHVEYLDADETRYRYPYLGERVIAAKYDPIAGWLDSHALVYRYVQSAPTAKVLLEIEDAQIKVANGRVIGVQTPNGLIATPHVVIAAGASSRQVGRTAGVELPLVLRPRQSFTTPWRHADYPEDGPFIIGAAPFPQIRPEAQTGALFGWEYDWNNKYMIPAGDPVREYLVDPLWPVERARDARFPSIVLALLARQLGHKDGYGFADSRYLRGVQHRAGYYTYRSPDNAYATDENGERHPYHSQRAIIDNWPTIMGLHLAVAHVGHGIMSSPMIGEIIASKVLGLALPDPVFADFGLDVPWVAHDSGGMSLE